MGKTTFKKSTTMIELDTHGLNPQTIRQLKSFINMITHVLTTDNEGEYFDGSAEAIRLCASLIKQARFVDEASFKSSIPYEEQALEYSLDVLAEHIAKSKVISYDC